MGTIIITGFSDSDKVPGFVGQTKYGAGPINAGSQTLTLLLVGLKTSAGTAVADQDVVEIFSGDDADAYFGAGSELARGCRMALKQSGGEAAGYKLMAAAVTASAGASAAATITITGTAGTDGVLQYWVGGELVQVSVTAGDAQNTIATNIEAAFDARPDLIVSAGSASNVVTLTHRHPGPRGNELILAQDTTLGPTVTASALGGTGSAINSNMRRFGGGTTIETYTTLLGVLAADRYHRVVWAANDATSLAAIETQQDAKAGPLQGKMEHSIVAGVGTLNATSTIANGTLNNHRFQYLWLENGETASFEIACAMGAKRSMAEGTQPNSGYDGEVLIGVLPQRLKSDWALRSEQQSALDDGVTPLLSNAQGEVTVVRSITTRSTDGASSDYRTLDTSEAVVPDAIRDGLRLLWTSEFKPNNPYVTADVALGQPEPPSGVATPSRWTARVTEYLKDREADLWITQVATNLPASEFNDVAKRIMSAVPVVPLPIQHQIGVVVRQLNVSA